MSKIEDMAIALDRAERERTPLPPLSETYPLLAPTEAYAIQNALFAIKLAQGTRLVGRKIGLTSQAMQLQMGVNQPDYGFLLDTMAVPSGGVLACSEFLQARIEPEIAFWLAADLRGPDITAEQVLAATRGVSAALELVDSRISNWRITLVDTIADNASSGRMIVSELVVPVEKLDLAAVRTELTRNGKPVGTGNGAAVLGHPALAVAWLANKLAEFDVTLLAGQIVLSGAMCAAVAVAPGDTFRATFTGLGEVSVSFT
jgi:2-keto-4-pentenoate hydratase